MYMCDSDSDHHVANKSKCIIGELQQVIPYMDNMANTHNNFKERNKQHLHKLKDNQIVASYLLMSPR